MERLRLPILLLALLSTLACGSSDPEPAPVPAPSFDPLTELLETQVFVEDLLRSGEAGDGRPLHTSRRLRATLEPPPRAYVAFDGRVVSGGPMTVTISADGDELFRQEIGKDGEFDKAHGGLRLDRYAGREIELELRAEGPEEADFRWRRVEIERYQSVKRRPAGEGRNLLFVVVDTLRADHTSLYGYHRPTTPWLDALAEESLVFEQAFAPASWTLPSTVSLLTGQSPPAHGVVGGGHFLASRFETLAELLAADGITTFAASANPLVGRDLGFSQGFETFYHRPWDRASILQKGLLVWLNQAADYRWAAYLHYIDPHDPYRAPDGGGPWVDPDYDGPFTRPKLLNRLYHTVNWGLEPPVEVDEDDIQHLRNAYDGEIHYWDERFGGLLNELRARGLLDQTVVIVTSDHGEEFRDHGFYKHGHQLYDESVRVPLLIHAPGLVEPGRRTDAVSLQGVFRAALQLMRIGPPPRDDDLLTPEIGGPIFGQVRVPVAPNDPRNRYTVRSVRDGRWWLTRTSEDAVGRLHDLSLDPRQQIDVAAEHPEEARRLGEMVDAWLAAESTSAGDDPPPEVDEEAVERLRALGYVQ